MLATLKANVAATLLGALSAILLAICVSQYVQLNGFLWIDGIRDDLADCERDRNELRAELKSISDKKNQQRDTTKGNVNKAETLRDKARSEAEKIERAPTAPNCETPPEILGADI